MTKGKNQQSCAFLFWIKETDSNSLFQTWHSESVVAIQKFRFGFFFFFFFLIVKNCHFVMLGINIFIIST